MVKKMKVPRGTERARRRVNLVRNWKTTPGAKQMLPTKEQEAQLALIGGFA